MPRENPLLTMGVPRAVIEREKAFGSNDGILSVAEANYRTFAKRYSSDLSDGDAALMIAFSQAMEELRDRDALEFYIDELVGAADVQELYMRKQAQQVVSRDTRALARVAANLAFVDQFELLGIEEPTSYLMDFHGQRAVIDVLSPTRARARITDLTTEDQAGFINSNQYKYQDGTWLESYIDTDYSEHWFRFERFLSDEVVRVVGFAPERLDSTSRKITDTPKHTMLDAPVTQVRLGWQKPEYSWFLSELHHDRNAVLPRLILIKQGQFAVTDRLLGVASFVEAS